MAGRPYSGQSGLEGWPDVDPGALGALPPSLRGVVRALGWTRAANFLAEYGGQVVHVPFKKESALGLTSKELGRLQTALKRQLSGVRGRYIALPKADKILKMQRNQLIAKDAKRLSANHLAKKYGITSRHVLNLKAANKVTINQTDSLDSLF